MSKVGDVVLNHKLMFRRVYVPYVTNMMYQETLVAKLLLVLLILSSFQESLSYTLSTLALLRVIVAVFFQTRKQEVSAGFKEA